MTKPDERLLSPRDPRARGHGDYSLHPLAALDGVLIYASLNGETVGFFFGTTEEAAAEAVAHEVARQTAPDEEETTR
jgi:hypothetical protein